MCNPPPLPKASFTGKISFCMLWIWLTQSHGVSSIAGLDCHLLAGWNIPQNVPQKGFLLFCQLSGENTQCQIYRQGCNLILLEIRALPGTWLIDVKRRLCKESCSSDFSPVEGDKLLSWSSCCQFLKQWRFRHWAMETAVNEFQWFLYWRTTYFS